MRLRQNRRPGITLVESAVVYPATLLLVVGLIIGALGVFRYQEMASLARRGARYAAVHGQKYAKDTGNTAATPADIYNNAIYPHAVGMDRSKLTYAVSYNTDNWPEHSTIVNGNVVAVTNTVTVTVSYFW